jgi:hypothetical protein
MSLQKLPTQRGQKPAQTKRRSLLCGLLFVLLVGLVGPGLAQGGWWWEKHFEGDYYSPLHYWLPGAYRWRAYHRPAEFAPLPQAPATERRAEPIPAPGEMKTPLPMPPANGTGEPIGPPGQKLNPGN